MTSSASTPSSSHQTGRTHGAEILYVITDLELGGVPLHLYRLAVAMQARGWRTSVVSLSPPGVVGVMLEEAGIPVRTCGGASRWDFRVIGRLAEIITEAKPDLVHSFLFHANLAARLAALSSRFPRNRVMCEIQTVEVERRWHLWVDRFTHRLGRFTIGNSPSVIKHLHRQAGIPTGRLRLVGGGIDVERIQAARPVDRASLGVNETDPMVLWVGRLDPVKGLDVLIRAFSTISRDTNAHLLLAGDGPLRDPLEKHARGLRLSSRVHFLGPRTDVPSLLKITDVFAFPSRTEGLPNALLEAMAAGCAIVTTDVPGCRDLISHGQSGLLVPFGDTQALAGAILRLFSDPLEARRLGQAAFEHVSEKRNECVTFDKYEGLYREALANLDCRDARLT